MQVRALYLILVCFASIATPTWAQLPATSLRSTYPAGGSPGSEMELKIFGTDLDDVSKLIFSHPGISAKPLIGEQGDFDEKPPVVPDTFVVTIAGNVPPGYYEVRCEGKYGVSNPRLFLITQAPHFLETEPNNELDQATDVEGQGILQGQINGQADIDRFRIKAQRGQRLMLRGLAARIDSPLELAMTLSDSSGQSVAPTLTIADGDQLIDFQVPTDGDYILEIHDMTFQQGETLTYCIEVGDFPFVASVYPPTVQRGATTPVTLYGLNLPQGKPSSLTLDGITLEEQVVNVTMPNQPVEAAPLLRRVSAHMAGMPEQLITLDRGPFLAEQVAIRGATAPVIQEGPENDRPETAQAVEWPVEIAARLYPQADMDWFTFSAKEGDTLAIELYSNRMGQPTDPALLLQRVDVNDQGEEQIRDVAFVDDVTRPNNNFQRGYHEFDRASTDPVYLLDVPQDGTYRLLVKDSYSSVRSDPRAIYCLAIREPQHGFHAVAVPGDSMGSMLLRQGGRDYVRIFVDRHDGYDGPIEVALTNLPQGVTAEPIVIGPGNSIGTLAISCAENAPAGQGQPRITATAKIADKVVTQQVPIGTATLPFQFNQPNSTIVDAPSRLTESMVICVSDHETTPATLTLSGDTKIETSRGGLLKIPYTVKRQSDLGGNLIGFPMDLPINTQSNQVNIGNNDQGEFDVRLLATTPPGTYTFYLAGYFQNMQYRRNPEAAEAAKVEQERINKILETATQVLKDAQTADQQAQQKLNTANQTFSQAQTNAQQKQQLATTTQTQFTEAQKKLSAAEEQLKAKPEDAGLQQQKATAIQELEKAKAAADDGAKQKAEADAAFETAMKAKTEAEEAKKTAAEKVTEAQQFQQKSQQKKQQTDQATRQAEQEAQPRNRNAHIPSNTITLVIHEFPIEVGLNQPSLEIEQGGKASFKVPVKRLYGFDQDVNLQVQRPGNLGSLQVPNGRIAKEAQETEMEFTAADNTPPGEHEVTLRLQMNFNGQNLQMDLPLKVTVKEKPAEDKS